MCDVWSCICNVPSCLGENALVIVAVEEGILHIALPPILATASRAHPVRFQARLLENDKEPSLAGRDAALGNVRLNGKHVWIRWHRQWVV